MSLRLPRSFSAPNLHSDPGEPRKHSPVVAEGGRPADGRKPERCERVANRRSTLLQMGQSLAGSYVQGAVCSIPRPPAPPQEDVRLVEQARQLVLEVSAPKPSSDQALLHSLAELQAAVTQKMLQ